MVWLKPSGGVTAHWMTFRQQPPSEEWEVTVDDAEPDSQVRRSAWAPQDAGLGRHVMLCSQITTDVGCTKAQTDFAAGRGFCSVIPRLKDGIASLPNGVELHEASRHGRIDSHSFRAYPASCQQRDFVRE